MCQIIKATESAKKNNPLFKDVIAEMAKNKTRLTLAESKYLNKMTGMSYGTVSVCLKQIKQFKEDKTHNNYDTLDSVFYALKNFVINQLQKNTTYSVWQDCWNDFSKELVKP